MSVGISGMYVNLCAYRHGTGHQVQGWKNFSIFCSLYSKGLCLLLRGSQHLRGGLHCRISTAVNVVEKHCLFHVT